MLMSLQEATAVCILAFFKGETGFQDIQVVLMRHQDVSSHVSGNKALYFKPNHHLFLPRVS